MTMKKFTLKFIAGSILLLGAYSTFADEPNPPVVPGSHGQGGDVPVGAPVDKEVYILLVMGAAYGGFKLYKSRKGKPGNLVNWSYRK